MIDYISYCFGCVTTPLAVVLLILVMQEIRSWKYHSRSSGPTKGDTHKSSGLVRGDTDE